MSYVELGKVAIVTFIVSIPVTFVAALIANNCKDNMSRIIWAGIALIAGTTAVAALITWGYIGLSPTI